MNKGPRLYNGPSDQERIARMQRNAAKRVKEIHRRRRTWYFLGFVALLLVLGLQLMRVNARTKQINQQVAENKAKLTQVTKTNKKLKNRAKNLKDPDYVAKWIRYKLYYSKNGEVIYNIPEPQDDN